MEDQKVVFDLPKTDFRSEQIRVIPERGISPEDAERQQLIVDSGDGYDAYLFAIVTPSADIGLLEGVIRDSSFEYIYKFARDVKGADVAALQEAFVVDCDGEDAYLFARDIDGAKIEALQQIVVERGSSCEAYQFARDVKGADIEALQQIIVDRGTGEEAYAFALNVAGADVDAMQKVVLDRGTAVDAFYFAREVDHADVAALFAHAKEGDLGKMTMEQAFHFREMADNAAEDDLSMGM